MRLTALINHLAHAAAALEADGHDPDKAEVLLATNMDAWSREHALGAIVTYDGSAYLVSRAGEEAYPPAGLLAQGDRHG